ATNTVKFNVWQSSTANQAAIGTTVVQPNTWTHIAGVCDGTNIYVYVNGVLDGSKASSGSAAGTGNRLYVGTYVGGAQIYHGLIDEVRITAATVYTTNFTPSNNPGIVTGTAGLWHFNEGSGLTANDSTTNAYNLTLQGAAGWSTSVP